jgi:hypothetical protein
MCAVTKRYESHGNRGFVPWKADPSVALCVLLQRPVAISKFSGKRRGSIWRGAPDSLAYLIVVLCVQVVTQDVKEWLIKQL